MFAENADITNLRVESLKTENTGQRVEIIAYDENDDPVHNIRFFNENGDLAVEVDQDIDSDFEGNPIAGIKASNPGDIDKPSVMSGNGVFSSGSASDVVSASAGIPKHNCSIGGRLDQRNIDPNGVSAGVMGWNIK
ncbi:hypothetical protein FKX85_06705 [Echinicola soli]|uniref:Uncharacterized protein n=1 Tax=Echinicola soli TaxID=2591634 RepID=A0A514CG05_9BACT|nr:hypothetical protein [Echinicola soli]QDH78742.1 hypothetical protein FKX85_06705 [Echinicola soli]